MIIKPGISTSISACLVFTPYWCNVTLIINLSFLSVSSVATVMGSVLVMVVNLSQTVVYLRKDLVVLPSWLSGFRETAAQVSRPPTLTYGPSLTCTAVLCPAMDAAGLRPLGRERHLSQFGFVEVVVFLSSHQQSSVFTHVS